MRLWVTWNNILFHHNHHNHTNICIYVWLELKQVAKTLKNIFSSSYWKPIYFPIAPHIKSFKAHELIKLIDKCLNISFSTFYPKCVTHSQHFTNNGLSIISFWLRQVFINVSFKCYSVSFRCKLTTNSIL